MEGRGDGEHDRPPRAAFFREGGGALDILLPPGNRHLPRRVDVRDLDARLGRERLHRLRLHAEHRRHRAVPELLHQLAAPPHEAHGISEG